MEDNETTQTIIYINIIYINYDIFLFEIVFEIDVYFFYGSQVRISQSNATWCNSYGTDLNETVDLGNCFYY